MCALSALSGVLTYLAVYLKLRCIIPALGDNNVVLSFKAGLADELGKSHDNRVGPLVL
jgi:hypothetical protein